MVNSIIYSLMLLAHLRFYYTHEPVVTMDATVLYIWVTSQPAALQQQAIIKDLRDQTSVDNRSPM